MKQLTLTLIFFSLALGCSEVRHDPVDIVPQVSEVLTAQIAKSALIEMLSAGHPDAMKRYEVEKWRNAPLALPLNSRLEIGPFQVDLESQTYTYSVGGEVLGKGWFREEGGDFKIENSKWIATPIQIKKYPDRLQKSNFLKSGSSHSLLASLDHNRSFE